MKKVVASFPIPPVAGGEGLVLHFSHTLLIFSLVSSVHACRSVSTICRGKGV